MIVPEFQNNRQPFSAENSPRGRSKTTVIRNQLSSLLIDTQITNLDQLCNLKGKTVTLQLGRRNLTLDLKAIREQWQDADLELDNLRTETDSLMDDLKQVKAKLKQALLKATAAESQLAAAQKQNPGAKGGLDDFIKQQQKKKNKAYKGLEPLSFGTDELLQVATAEATPLVVSKSKASTWSQDIEVDIGFLFASPVVLENQLPGADLELVEFDPIGWKKELGVIKTEVKRKELQMKIEASVGTRDTLSKMLKKRIRILHFSCHGIMIKEQQKHQRQRMALNEKDKEELDLQNSYLLLESEMGDGDLVSAAEISSMIKDNDLKLDLVVLQACQSEMIGRVFQENLANHVICINQDRSVLDEVAQDFTKNLYQNLLRGQTVCRAFENAIDETKFALGRGKESEAERDKMFKLLLPENHPSRANKKSNNHFCNYIVSKRGPPKGQYKCMSNHTLVKALPDLTEMETNYRLRERQQVVKALCRGERLVVLHGLFGDGKENVAKASLRFVADRKKFCGGIIHLNLTGVATCKKLLHKLRSVILREVGWSSDRMQVNPDQHEEGFKTPLGDFFNQRGSMKISPESKNLYVDSKLKFVLMIENAEEIMAEEKEKFTFLTFFRDLMESCPLLSILICTYEWMYEHVANLGSTIIFIKELEPLSSVDLFIDSLGEHALKAEEVLRLVLETPSDCKELLLPEETGNNAFFEVTDFQKSRMLHKLKTEPGLCRTMLSKHDLFKQLNYNPYSIKTLASFYKNPFVENNDLVGIYRRVLSSEFFCSDDSRGGSGFGQEARLNSKTSPQKRMEAQMKAIEAILILLKEKSAAKSYGAIDLFYFLGSFPHGLSNECLQSIWPSNTLQANVFLFEKLGLIDSTMEGQSRKTMSRFLVNFVETSQFDQVSRMLMSMICQYFTNGLLKRVQEARAHLDEADMAAAWSQTKHFFERDSNILSMGPYVKTLSRKCQKKEGQDPYAAEYAETLNSFKQELKSLRVILDFYKKRYQQQALEWRSSPEKSPVKRQFQAISQSVKELVPRRKTLDYKKTRLNESEEMAPLQDFRQRSFNETFNRFQGLFSPQNNVSSFKLESEQFEEPKGAPEETKHQTISSLNEERMPKQDEEQFEGENFLDMMLLGDTQLDRKQSLRDIAEETKSALRLSGSSVVIKRTVSNETQHSDLAREVKQTISKVFLDTDSIPAKKLSLKNTSCQVISMSAALNFDEQIKKFQNEVKENNQALSRVSTKLISKQAKQIQTQGYKRIRSMGDKNTLFKANVLHLFSSALTQKNKPERACGSQDDQELQDAKDFAMQARNFFYELAQEKSSSGDAKEPRDQALTDLSNYGAALCIVQLVQIAEMLEEDTIDGNEDESDSQGQVTMQALLERCIEHLADLSHDQGQKVVLKMLTKYEKFSLERQANLGITVSNLDQARDSEQDRSNKKEFSKDSMPWMAGELVILNQEGTIKMTKQARC